MFYQEFCANSMIFVQENIPSSDFLRRVLHPWYRLTAKMLRCLLLEKNIFTCFNSMIQLTICNYKQYRQTPRDVCDIWDL